MSIVTRFAPSPTGYLHLGHAASALIGFEAARATGGEFLLRLEDIDAGRCRTVYAEAIVEDLAWLGMTWHGAVRRQSGHMADYAAALDDLTARGLLYPCFCTRAEIAAAMSAPHGGDRAYPGTCRNLDPALAAARIAQGDAYALRLRTDAAMQLVGALRFHEAGEGWVEADPSAFGDVVLARKDALCSYHLCVTHDDALQGITLVTRGQDLRSVTPVHVLLQRLFGWPTPHYAHHPLLTDEAGKRLAKRDRAATLREMRAAGATPAEIVKIISCRIGRITSL